MVLVSRGFIPSALVCPSLSSSTILHILILNGLALSVHYHRLVTRFSQNFIHAKLRAYGVGEEAIDFLHSYFSGRKQRVKVNGVFSDWLPVYCGVPQGSLLRLLLFNVFINDLNFSVQLSSLRLYADDTTAYASNTDISALELSLNKILRISHLASNYLSVNSKKTQAMILGKHSHEPALHIGDSVIEISGVLNILGVGIGDKLCFKDHLSTVLRTVYAKVGAIIIDIITILSLTKLRICGNFRSSYMIYFIYH